MVKTKVLGLIALATLFQIKEKSLELFDLADGERTAIDFWEYWDR